MDKLSRTLGGVEGEEQHSTVKLDINNIKSMDILKIEQKLDIKT